MGEQKKQGEGARNNDWKKWREKLKEGYGGKWCQVLRWGDTIW